MSAAQSKSKKFNGKRGDKFAASAAGSVCEELCGAMTKDDQFTLSCLQNFQPEDFEEYRNRGEEFRLRMSGAVLKALNISDEWDVDCENRCEWGGFFPVHLRLTHTRGEYVTLDILSPSKESPFWHGLIWINTDHTGLYFWNAERLEPETICPLLSRVDELVNKGITGPGDVAAILRQGELC